MQDVPTPSPAAAASPTVEVRGGLLPAGFPGGSWILLVVLASIVLTNPALVLSLLLSVSGEAFEAGPLPTAVRVVIPVLFGAGVLLSLRLTRVRVVATQGALIVVNVMHALHFAWSEIAHVDLDHQSTQRPRSATAALARVRIVSRIDRRFVATGSTCSLMTRSVTLAPLLTQIQAKGILVLDQQ